MKNLFSLFSLALVALFWLACESSDPNHQAQNQLRDEVMVIHDEVMPKMGEIHRLKKDLKKVAGTDELPADGPISQAVAQLEAADEGMMSWMAEFKQPSKLRGEWDHDRIMAYLHEEKVKIGQVKEDMLNAIAEATELLESYTKAE